MNDHEDAFEPPFEFDRFDVLMFDCYGTLIDWEAGILTALEPVRDRYGVELGDEAVLAAFGRAEATCEEARPDAPYPSILADVFRVLAEEWDVPPDDDAADRFGASVGEWPAFSDTPKALRALAVDFDLAVLSNVDRASFEATRSKHLGVEFAHVMTRRGDRLLQAGSPQLRVRDRAVGRRWSRR